MPANNSFNPLEIFDTKITLRQYLEPRRHLGLRIAFVPTMGALHQGHIALVDHAKTLADMVVCSIFVNPTQFNDPADLAKYPRPLERDIALLQEAGCDILFHPEVGEIYANEEHWHIDLGHLDQVLEGAFRPGHFQGVTQVVKKLFDAVQPDIACFGQKDFQQYKVVEALINQFQLPVQLEMCPTVREPDGLAMSSRNVRLTSDGRKRALALYQTLSWTKENLRKKGLDDLRIEAIDMLKNNPHVDLEYFAIYDADTFTETDDAIQPDRPLVILIAAWVEGVRLIDNMILGPDA